MERDHQIIASTGRGKTLAYVLPTLDALRKCVDKDGRILVVVPTLDLARQVARVFHPFAEAVGATVVVNRLATRKKCSNFGRFRRKQRFLATQPCGYHLEYDSEQKDILILTPTELQHFVSFYRQNTLQTCIIDEADKLMYQMHQGSLSVLNSIILSTYESAQAPVGKRVCRRMHTILASATLCHNGSTIRSIQTLAVRNVLENGSNSKLCLATGLTEIVLLSKYTQKLEVLRKLLSLFGGVSVLIITSSVSNCTEVWRWLKKYHSDSFPVKYCGSLPKLQQMCAIEVFSTKCSRVMVASDAAARGLDLPDVKLVVCYDVPDHFETYVHRVGRTARAGATGIAITVCSHSERPHLQALLNMLERKNDAIYVEAGDILEARIPVEFMAKIERTIEYNTH